MHWWLASGLWLLYQSPLAAGSCITAMSVTDQYDAGEFELATENSLIRPIKVCVIGRG